uniref:Uncharacterized protein n=1 Tax=Chromera velia CCMP2878 TaxID=1169474 RepID=A0A0G4IDB9_9ALVE|eukprot:Cvel_13294.t1-p1 / transcript=Cvel_13294.t1 / gene=Cvel_13294 / organism=Chromera_velia_CCMP2878 / gene_product=hypothetical protein / transcript_product=hypothetical protein / location=Cvel_scaffold902:20825-24269(+) / protein_length=151 / sequence_SO=supercontig / SO=protein_coding / is_pseudo=false
MPRLVNDDAPRERYIHHIQLFKASALNPAHLKEGSFPRFPDIVFHERGGDRGRNEESYGALKLSLETIRDNFLHWFGTVSLLVYKPFGRVVGEYLKFDHSKFTPLANAGANPHHASFMNLANEIVKYALFHSQATSLLLPMVKQVRQRYHE